MRDAVRPADAAAVAELVAATGFFSPDERAIAVELVQEALARGDGSDYRFLFADAPDGSLAGYTCYGPIPATAASFDLYWIAVSPGAQRQGLGSALLRESESAIRRLGGRRVYIDTSGRAQYAPTRAFYESAGYRVAADLEDYYAPGDAKIIFCKAL